MRLATVLALVALIPPAPLYAQPGAGSQPSAPSSVTIAGSFRARVESWDWFGNDPDGEYTYPGSLFRLALSKRGSARDWQVEVAVPVLLGLPQQSPGAVPQGLGTSYFLANERRANVAMLFVERLPPERR